MASLTTTASLNGTQHGAVARVDEDYPTRLRRARIGLFVAAMPIVMLFTSFTSAYVVRQGLPTFDPRTNTMVLDWVRVQLPGILFVNTCVLLLSSAAMELARRQAHREAAAELGEAGDTTVNAKAKSDIPWLAIATVLGLVFLWGQWIAWGQLQARGFYVQTTPSSSFIYLLTGTHAVHLLGGVIALLVAAIALRLHRSVMTRGVVVDVAGWYWHLMAAIWVYILCLLEFAG